MPVTTSNQSNTLFESARPFVKWAGGKKQLLSELLALCPPKKYYRYFEPFLGSGALFFALQPSNAVLNDSNEELMNCYKIIQTVVGELVLLLQTYQNSELFFYSMRAKDPALMTPVERAARLIYLNKTCFNGLYRVNKKGFFNTPYGRYQNPKICDTENLRRVSEVLKGVKLFSGRYQDVLLKTSRHDFVYLDPPYYPISKYSDFKRYTKEFFYPDDHEELAKRFQELDEKGCYVMLSNSDHPFVRRLYRGYSIKTVKAKRLINKIASQRMSINELIIRNY